MNYYNEIYKIYYTFYILICNNIFSYVITLYLLLDFISYFVIIFRFYIIPLLINIFQPSNQLQANQFYPMARSSSLYFIRHHDLYLCHKRANSWQTVSRQQHSLGTREKICQADSSSFVLTLLPAIVRKCLLSVAKIHSIYVLDLIIIILLFDNNNVIKIFPNIV